MSSSSFSENRDGLRRTRRKEYGEFELYVEQNNELIGRILQKGEKLEVISPLDVRKG